MEPEKINSILIPLFRTESGRMSSVLTRLLGFQNLETAEDIVQDTLLQAMSTWKYKGVPDNPSAWLYAVAKRKAIDVLRKNKVRSMLDPEVARFLSSEYTLSPTVNQYFLENEIQDSQLRMIFALCHPSIPYDAQIALTLKTLCGLSVSEIAKSFLTNEETITKRLFRAREKIREEKIKLDVPYTTDLSQRLDAVHHTLYLLFNEGYNSSHPDVLIREDLCAEAIRLMLILTSNQKTNTSETNALLALMCLQAAREDARLNSFNGIILLKDQDRSKWNQALIKKGLQFLDQATGDNSMSAYHLEAAIAGLHAVAKSFEETDWHKIVTLYDLLEKIKAHPIIQLNRAIAIGYANGRGEGLKAILKINGLENSHLYHAALADFYFAEGMKEKSANAYRQALNLVTSSSEKELLQKKLSLVTE
ncbi:MAG TPA: sigma-70 family RNA polymerase sigma factor [Chryseosolibacter sp.]